MQELAPAAEYLPAVQSVQELAMEAEYLPRVQSVQRLAPAAEYLPAAQFVQPDESPLWPAPQETRRLIVPEEPCAKAVPL